jgi:prepilin-type N-terminal cleavage/methylation domain-containing protein
MNSVGRGYDGFTLIELLIATAIMLTVTASIFAVLNPAQGMFAAQPEVMDIDQRLRIGVDGLGKDLMTAGAGSLGGWMAPVLPYRTGALGADPAGHYFADRVTVMYVPPAPARTRIAGPVDNGSATPRVTVMDESGCARTVPACGFKEGMAVLIGDAATGAWDTFTVLEVQGASLQLRHRGLAPCKAYESGSYLSQIVAHTYWLNTDDRTDTVQLMRYDNDKSDLPVADNVVGLSFEYFADAWPAGGGSEPVPLSPAELTDGPWRPDAASEQRYDADLLRVRRVRVTLRVQAASQFRGPAGHLFRRGGTSTAGERYLPDREITFDVAPRNLGLGARE